MTDNSGRTAAWSGAVRSPQPMMSQRRIDNLDMLRAAAIVLVLVYHMGVMSPPSLDWPKNVTSFGEHGVDVFFVLSGWLIGGLYWRERQIFSDVAIGLFLTRRWLRTLPPYFAALALSFAAASAAHGARFDWTYLLFLQNYEKQVPFFDVSWSLCVEEHFYLLLPFIFALTRRPALPLSALFVAAVLSSIMGRYAHWAEASHDFGRAQTGTHLNLCGLTLGVGLAYISTHSKAWTAKITKAAPFALGISTVWIILLQSSSNRLQFALTSAAVAVVFASLLLLLLQASPFVAVRWIRPIALSSYSVYLTHALALHAALFLMKYCSVGSAFYIAVSLALVGLFGGAMYFAVERPAILLRDRLWPRRSFSELLLGGT